MARKKAARSAPKSVETLTHDEASRPNIPTAEQQSLAELADEKSPRPPVRYPRARPLEPGEMRERDGDLDPQIVWNGVSITLTPEQVEHLRQNKGRLEIGDAQLVWRGKDTQDWADLVVDVPPLYVQETINPKSLIDALKKDSEQRDPGTPDLFETLRVSEEADRTEFYQHEQGWSNRMILGDSLQVMASLAERERLRGKVQAIYFDPPYGITFNSNWQVSTRNRGVEDGKAESMTREPEQVKAFRDTWKDGIHSYLTYLRDRFTVMRDLLTDSGSLFVQIGDENVHRVRALLDEVFGAECCVVEILVKKKGSQKGGLLDPVNDYVLWYGKSPRDSGRLKVRSLFVPRELDYDTVNEFSRLELPDGSVVSMKNHVVDGETRDYRHTPERIAVDFPGGRLFRPWPITNGGQRRNQMKPVVFEGRPVSPPKGRCWSHASVAFEGEQFSGMDRVGIAGRLFSTGSALDFKRYLDDFPFKSLSNWWDGLGGAAKPLYVVQTNEAIVRRCLLMSTDPGDLVLDATCGSGTTAAVAEQWGRRWITIDTSRVALALARQRLVAARYPFYLLADSAEGREHEAELSGTSPPTEPASGDVRQGFVYHRARYIKSSLFANNRQIDDIWETSRERLDDLLDRLNDLLGTDWQEWQVPRSPAAVEKRVGRKPSAEGEKLLAAWWKARETRQEEIDESVGLLADVELLYDQPYKDSSKVRVAGPFTVESLSPHRTVPMDDAGSADSAGRYKAIDNEQDFVTAILENLRTSGVQQQERRDRIAFNHIAPWPGEMIHAEGRFTDSGEERRAAICIGPEYGTLHRTDLTTAAREAADARFDVLVCCAFNYDPHVTDLAKLGPMPILKAKMNPDLHMAEDLRRDKNANLFMIIGEPDVTIDEDGNELIVTVRGLDVFDMATGNLRAGDTDDIAAWFIDTDYDGECFFVRHAYFLGAGDPYKSLKTALKTEIDAEAWESLYSDVSRPFQRPAGGQIAVKVIDHFGDEVMKVVSV